MGLMTAAWLGNYREGAALMAERGENGHEFGMQDSGASKPVCEVRGLM